jgi:hypothetical protein
MKDSFKIEKFIGKYWGRQMKSHKMINHIIAKWKYLCLFFWLLYVYYKSFKIISFLSNVLLYGTCHSSNMTFVTVILNDKYILI